MLPTKFSLNGRAALITGASGLLGREHAFALLEVGASVVLTDILLDELLDLQAELQTLFPPEKIMVCKMDVTNKEDIIAASHDVKRNWGRLDVLVNNAAIDPKVGSESPLIETSRFENLSLDEWNLQLNVGLAGAFLCSQVFGAQMAADGRGGVILNIASDLSVFSPDQRLYRKDELPEELQPVKPVTYSVVKTGLIGLTRYLATYWASQGVRCNALSPGGVYNGQDKSFVNRLTRLIPLNRMATASEYRATVQYLCTDASAYTTGQNIIVDGGRSVW